MSYLQTEFIPSILFSFRQPATPIAPKTAFVARVYCIQFDGNLCHLKNFVKKKKL